MDSSPFIYPRVSILVETISYDHDQGCLPKSLDCLILFYLLIIFIKLSRIGMSNSICIHRHVP